MKKLLKVIGIIFILLLAALIIVPMIFKEDIVKIVKKEANNAVNAKIDFGDFDLSLIKSFPDFYFTIENVSVTGIDQFDSLELATIKELDLIVDLMSVVKGETINVKQITILEPKVHAKVLKDGTANYLIAKEDTTAQAEVVDTAATAGSFKMDLQEFEIIDGAVIYDDATLPILMNINNLDLDIKGDFTENITNLDIDGGIETFNLTFDGINYMNDVKVLLDVVMQMNLEEFKFTFKENEVRLNELPIGFNGWVAMPNNPINMDFTFNAKETDFKELLSMIPAEFAKDLEGVKTSGTMALDGYVKGTFIDSTYPAFGANMIVENARFQYPDLPKAVEDIQIRASVTNKDGDLNNTIVDVPVFHLKMAENPFDLNFYLATPMSDPFIRAGMKGKLVLDNIKEMVPLEEGDELGGTFNADVKVEGNMSTIENEQYEDFKANGVIVAENIHYASDSLDYPVDIKKANLNFSPRYVQLSEMVMQLGKSDLSANGRVENFIGYAMSDDQVLKGNLKVNSNYLDINELAGIEPSGDALPPGTEPEIIDGVERKPEEEGAMEVVVLPKNIEFVTNASVKKLIFDNVEIDDITGEVDFRDQKVSMNNTAMKMLGGNMLMNGYYETTDSVKPTYDFGMDIKNFNLSKTISTFASIKALVPIAEKAEGSYSTSMKVRGALDDKMEPIFETIFGSGNMLTQNMTIQGYKPLEKISKVIKSNRLNPLNVDNQQIKFNLAEGKLFIEPFDLKMGDTKLTIAGSNSFDQTIDYVFSFAIPREEFGGAANNALDGLLSQASSKGVDLNVAETINIDINLVGPFSNPEVKSDLKKTKSNVTNALKEKAQQEIDKKKEELEQKAKEELDKKKEELRKEAERKAQEEIDKQKKEAEDKLKDDAKKKLKGLFK